MDNCDLEKLAISTGTLQPAFHKDISDYTVRVESEVASVRLDLLTSDCDASYTIRFGDGSSTIQLSDGVNRVEIEVVAEDGTTKKYSVEITKLSAKIAELSQLTLEGDFPLKPPFSTVILEYNSTVPFHCKAVTLLPKPPDKNIKVEVNGADSSLPVPLNVGDTTVEVHVCSVDGSNSQVYTVLVSRELIPMAVTFANEKQQLEYECPVSLNPFHSPVSINNSEPKHVFSGPYIDMLSRRSKVDPLSDAPLGDAWRVVETELDKEMSAAPVKCFFTYRGCDRVMELSELGSHALDCPHKPTGELDAKDVTEAACYQKLFASSSSSSEVETKHTVELRQWEKRLQMTVGDDNLEKLCSSAQEHLKRYQQNLPKPGDSLRYEDGQSPLHSLEQAAVHYASAIQLCPADAGLHFLLGLVLEEQHYAAEMYGLRRKADTDKDEVSQAKSEARQDDILAVCKLHGFSGTPTVENQLQALDKEYQLLKDQGQSGKADYVQTLFLWLSKKTGKDSSAAVKDEESCFHRALMKYLDAWSLSRGSWEYNLHVGRMLLLLQARSREALQHLQAGLAAQPTQPALRFFTALALLQQEEKASEGTEKEAALFLQQGLEHFINQRFSSSVEPPEPSDPLSSRSTQFLRGLFTLAQLQQRNAPTQKAVSPELVYHTVAVLAAHGVSRCVCRGQASAQLEWLLLDSHFALLQRLIGLSQSKARADGQRLVGRRCKGLAALIRLTSIAPCQELLDMQEKACQLAVVTSPRSSHALCRLGLAQLSQYDNNSGSDRSKVVLADACLSFQASIELENKSQSGETPEQLTKQTWMQERLEEENRKKQAAAPPTAASDTAAAVRGARGRGGVAMGRGAAAAPKATGPPTSMRGAKTARPPAKPPAARGRAAAPAAPATRSGKTPSTTQTTACESKPDPGPSTVKTAEVPAASAADSGGVSTRVNRSSHVSRLGLARAFSYSADTQEQAKQLYQEVISMAPEVHDAYIELVQLLEPSDPRAALEVYCGFPLKPVQQQSFDDAFITGETVRMMMAQRLYEHPQLGGTMVAYGKVMGISCIEKYINILDEQGMAALLRSVYAGIHDKKEDDRELQDFFKYKCWI